MHYWTRYVPMIGRQQQQQEKESEYDPGFEKLRTANRQALHSPTSARPLSPKIRRSLENRFGVELSSIRTYHDEAAAHALNARAYNQGNAIVLSQSYLSGNEALIRHETAHLLQAASQQAYPGRSQRGTIHERDADRLANGEAAQSSAPVPEVQRQEGAEPVMNPVIRRETVRIMLFHMAVQQGAKGTFALTPEIESELQRLIPEITRQQMRELWTPEPTNPNIVFQRILNAGLLPLYSEPLGPQIVEPPTPQTSEPEEKQKSVDAGLDYAGGVAGFNVTINPQPPAQISAVIRQQFMGNSISLSSRELQAILAGREQAVLQLDAILGRTLPSMGVEDRLQLSQKIADILLNEGINAHLRSEAPNALERHEANVEQMRHILGLPEQAQGPVESLLKMVPIGVSLTIHF